jgi:N-methylhydantoinase A
MVTAGDAARPEAAAGGPGYVVGIDTGGTFTDAVVIDPTGRVFIDKAFSTPDDPSVGARDALGNVAARIGVGTDEILASCRRLAHGTTVATNALLQRTGARVGLVTTRGFEDTVIIARGPMGRNTGIPLEQALDFVRNEKPPPYVERTLTFGVGERIDIDGDVVGPLREGDVGEVAAELRRARVGSVAVSLLWSFRNPRHEARVRELLQDALPGLEVSLSSEVSPVSGEYERTMTTVVNAYLAPVLARYIGRLADELSAEGLRYPVQLMTCAGGTIFPKDVARRAVSLVNGGPVGGLVAARELGAMLGFEDAITTDMGGTSFDVGIIHRGLIRTEASTFVSQGTPVQLEAAKVETIGAGGGSIAWTDGERLLVGPRSAGSRPGPACYGHGGTEPTVTDALVVLGLLDPGSFFGGRTRLRADLAEATIRERVAQPLGMDVETAAAGIYEIVTARMSDLVRQTTVQEGLDPRQFTLVAFGGAAPLHAAAYAEPLGVREVIVPATSSVFSALGCALSDVRYSYARSAPILLEAAGADVVAAEVYADLERRALADMAESGHAGSAVRLRHRLDARFAGQMNELTIEVPRAPDGFVGAVDFVGAVRAAFQGEYASRFGSMTLPRRGRIEVITFRVEALVAAARPPAAPIPSRSGRAVQPTGRRRIVTRQYGAADAAVYDGARLLAGDRMTGPAVVDRADTTIFIPAGHRAEVDAFGNVHIDVRTPA